MSTASKVSLLAPAKVNLTLQVLGRRDDGYHELRTWMAALELADRLTVEPTSDGRVELNLSGRYASPDVPVDGTNLATRAAQEALELARREGSVAKDAGVRLTLEKNVPSQAGLGGASSDAAAAWLGTETALGVQLGADLRRHGLGRLGSDCVFFIDALSTGLGLCVGRGEEVSPSTLPAPAWWVAVVTPDVVCPTAEVYGALENSLRRSRETQSVPIEPFGTRASEARRWLSNDLEGAALEARPELVSWREALGAAGCEHFLLSGSGSSFYGLFDDSDAARQGLESVAEAARARGLEHRGQWLTKLGGFGLKFLSDC